MILFYIQSSVVAQSCESIQQHRFSGSLKLEIKSCIEPLQIQLIWQNKDKTIRQNYFNLDAVDVETQQYGDVIALDFYQERGGTLFLVNGKIPTLPMYRLNYTGHDESSLCLSRQGQYIAIQRCAFDQKFGTILNLKADSKGQRVLNPKALPEFNNWQKLRPLPSSIQIPKL